MLGVYVLVLVLLYCEFLPTVTELLPINESSSNVVTDVTSSVIEEKSTVVPLTTDEIVIEKSSSSPLPNENEFFIERFTKLLIFKKSVKLFEENFFKKRALNSSLDNEKDKLILEKLKFLKQSLKSYEMLLRKSFILVKWLKKNHLGTVLTILQQKKNANSLSSIVIDTIIAYVGISCFNYVLKNILSSLIRPSGSSDSDQDSCSSYSDVGSDLDFDDLFDSTSTGNDEFKVVSEMPVTSDEFKVVCETVVSDDDAVTSGSDEMYSASDITSGSELSSMSDDNINKSVREMSRDMVDDELQKAVMMSMSGKDKDTKVAPFVYMSDKNKDTAKAKVTPFVYMSDKNKDTAKAKVTPFVYMSDKNKDTAKAKVTPFVYMSDKNKDTAKAKVAPFVYMSDKNKDTKVAPVVYVAGKAAAQRAPVAICRDPDAIDPSKFLSDPRMFTPEGQFDVEKLTKLLNEEFNCQTYSDDSDYDSDYERTHPSSTSATVPTNVDYPHVPSTFQYPDTDEECLKQIYAAHAARNKSKNYSDSDSEGKKTGKR